MQIQSLCVCGLLWKDRNEHAKCRQKTRKYISTTYGFNHLQGNKKIMST